MTPRLWSAVRTLAGVAVLGAVLSRTGTAPFLSGLRSVGVSTLAVGVVLGVVTTAAGAWRWRLVAGALGVGIGKGPAVAACYRSQLLNSVLPGGVVGDVHRGVAHGRETGDVGLALRAVAWERFAGQAVQAVVALAVLALLPSPVRAHVPAALLGLVALGALAAVVWRCRVASRSPAPRLLGSLRADLMRGLLTRRTWPGVVLASTVALTGYVVTYLVAARAVGASVAPQRLLPLVLLVLVAAAVPMNVAGWGPREGMAAWSFGAAGLGAAQGVEIAAAYGVIVLVASSPGVVVLAVAAGNRPRERVLSGGPGG